MGTCEDNDNTTTPWALKRHSEEPELGLKWSQSTFDMAEEEALVLKFQSVGLKSNDNDNTTDEHNDYGDPNDSRLYPLRPYAEDCPHYLRTGTCKFGFNCKFNHPLKRTNQVGKDKDNEGFSEKSEQMECKYYLTAGGCKYGKSCRFTHSKPQSDISAPELNFLGLPMRLGERECPFYMRNGSCGYGARCRFHHPDPTSVGGSGPHNSTLDYDNGENVPSHMLGASQPAQASWSSPMISDTSVPYLDNHLSYTPSTNLLSQGVHQNPKWSGYQVPDYSQEINWHPRSAPAVNSFMKKADMEGEEFPERPGQPECDYFMRTGECKFKSACRYHHPKNWAPKADVVVLSDIGLPLRPGKKICRHYESYGICKYGRACLFDHPVNNVSSTYPDGPC